MSRENPCAEIEVGQGDRTPPSPEKITKNIGVPSTTGPDPLNITKLPSQHSMLGHNRHASETPFKYLVANFVVTSSI